MTDPHSIRTPSPVVSAGPALLPDAAVSLRAVTKSFGSGESQTLALRGVDLDVGPGEMTLLVGPSGCGKTTLISIIAGLLNPNVGQVTVLGARLDQLRGSQLVRFRAKNIGFVFQQYNLLPTLSALENVAVPLVLAGEYRQAALQQARFELEEVGLVARMHALPSQLSGGQQQRVAIARALVHRPRLLVCDEPTAAIDAVNGQLIMQMLARIAIQSDRAVIIVTHDSRVFQYGHRIVYMNDGVVDRVEVQEQSQLAVP